MLLCDGFDEVVGDAVVQRVRESIAAASRTYPQSPLLVTCRMLDYQSSPLRQMPDFQLDTLAPLDDEQIMQSVAAWYAELAASGRQMPGDPAALIQAINGRPELRELAGLPLLLTMMAIVHAGLGTLPEARAQLYHECVKLLLLRWRQEEGQPDVLAQLDLPQFGRSDLLRLMARLGFAAHERAARDPTLAAQAADLTRADVQKILADTSGPTRRTTRCVATSS